MPIISMYPVTSHCSVPVPTEKTLPSVGSAMFREVSLSIPTNAPISMDDMASHGRSTSTIAVFIRISAFSKKISPLNVQSIFA